MSRGEAVEGMAERGEKKRKNMTNFRTDLIYCSPSFEALVHRNNRTCKEWTKRISDQNGFALSPWNFGRAYAFQMILLDNNPGRNGRSAVRPVAFPKSKYRMP